MVLSKKFFICLVIRKLPLGIEDGRIPDGNFRASSIWNYQHRASNARLNAVRRRHRTGGWSSRYNKRGQWIQFDVGRLAYIVGIATQGRQDYNQWVTKFKLSYSRDGLRFTWVKAGRRIAVSCQSYSSIRKI